jgi:hypothetical protein
MLCYSCTPFTLYEPPQIEPEGILNGGFAAAFGELEEL